MKRKMRKVTRSFWALMLAFAMLCSGSTVAMAAEPEATEAEVEASEVSADEEVVLAMATSGDSAADVPTPYGSLSGYGQKKDDFSGHFEFDVNGSWSPFAGCTLRTEGFNGSTHVAIKVYDANNDLKAQGTLSGTDEKRNLAMANVSPGRWRCEYVMTNPSEGTVIVQVY